MLQAKPSERGSVTFCQRQELNDMAIVGILQSMKETQTNISYQETAIYMSIGAYEQIKRVQ